jgi:hypothetical protein
VDPVVQQRRPAQIDAHRVVLAPIGGQATADGVARLHAGRVSAGGQASAPVAS